MRYTLLIATQDKAGLVYQVSGVLYEAVANIERQDEYVDKDNGLFFMRTSFVLDSCVCHTEALAEVSPNNLCHTEGNARSISNTLESRDISPTAQNDKDLDSSLPTKVQNDNGLDLNSKKYCHDFVTSKEVAKSRNDDAKTLESTLITKIQHKLESILPRGASIALKREAKKSLVILATKENHCLGDLLLRQESGELNAQIKAVIANRNDLASLVERFNIPFFWVDSDGVSREAHEARLREIIDKFSPDLLALAKYMRILSPEFVEAYAGRIINIHHSFLPAFVGANPYKQAHKRGVKIIGATAHFVTNALDEGPIIAQDIIHINHTYSWRDMQKAGRDVEKAVFAHALDLVLNDRVFVSGNKTIVF